MKLFQNEFFSLANEFASNRMTSFQKALIQTGRIAKACLCSPPVFMNATLVFLIQQTNRIFDGVEAETRKSQASFQII